MKVTIIISLQLLISCSLFSQKGNTKTFYDKNWKICDEKEAAFYRIMSPTDSGKYLVKDYFISGKLQMEGTYNDQDCKCKSNKFTWYYENGNKSTEQNFKNCLLNGLAKYWFNNGQLSSIGEYADSLKSGLWKRYYVNGVLESEGNYEKGKQVGEWMYFDSTKRLTSKAKFKDGQSKRYNYDANGKIIDSLEDIQIAPQYPGGDSALFAFLHDNTKYPEDCLKHRHQGKVYVLVMISKTGELRDAKIKRGVDEDIDREALKVINLMPNWKPATQNNKPVAVYMTIPINFKLK